MPPTDKPTLDALLRISKARAALVLNQPFFAALALRLDPVPLVNHPIVHTMATDGRALYFCPEWVNTKPHDELIGVVAHEAMHCALLHPFRRDHRDPVRWNIAVDHAVNLILKASGFRLPKEGLCDPRFTDMAGEAIYPLIPEQPAPPNWCFGGMGSCEDAPGEDGKSPGPAELEALAREWQVAVLQAAQAAKAQGNLPGCLDALAESIRAPQIDWRAALRAFVRSAAKNDYSWRRPNVRFLAAGDYLPSLYDETVGPLVLGVDTSGSVSQAELDAVCAELNGVLDATHPESVHVVYCDTQAYEGEAFGPEDWPVTMQAKGRGGTHLAPVWDYVRDRDLNPVCTILTTDMELCVADLGNDPGFPVLVLSTGREAPMDGPLPFGTLLPLRVA